MPTASASACPRCGSTRVLTLPRRDGHNFLPTIYECRACGWSGDAKELQRIASTDSQSRGKPPQERTR